MVRVKSARILIAAHKFFRNLPDGETVAVPIPGDFTEYWTKADFMRWFHKCLSEKINREDQRNWQDLSRQYESDLKHDCRIVRDYARGIRWPGINMLNLPELKARFPHINNQRTWLE